MSEKHELKTLTLAGETFDSFQDKEAREAIEDLKQGGGSTHEISITRFDGGDKTGVTISVEHTNPDDTVARESETVYDGKNGITPHIGDNGNWWIGDTDTGVSAGGSDSSQNVTVEPAEDDIPKVFFTGDTTGMNKSTSVDLAFEYRSKTATHRGVANVKWQGSSSLSYPEKNYTIKLFADAAKSEKLKLNMKGWGKENKFCLKANYVDTLHLRNLVGARIAYDMIKSRNDFASLPAEMQEAPRCGVVDGFPVKVFINGVLQGVYTWNIPKDKWCMNMDDENANHAFLMAEKNNNGSATSDALILACEFRHNATIFADTSEAQYPPYDWVVEGPGDDVGTNIRESFNALINCVKDTDDATFKATIGNHLDLTSAFDYYSFAYLMCHYDGLGKNLGMATYDGVKWFCVLYDMDSTFGAKIDGSGFLATNRKCPEEYQETNSLLWQRIEKCFGAELYARYMELRNGALSLSNILTHAERFYDTIPSEYYAEDRAIWTGKPSKDTNTIGRLRTYIVERSAYVDSEMLAISEGADLIPCTGITLSATELTFTGAGTQTLTATVEPENTTDSVIWSIDDTSVATVSGGVVRAKANGNATITASCGGFSATCEISVSGIDEAVTDNILENAVWSAEFIDTTTGIAQASSADVATDYFDISAYAGKRLFLEYPGANPNNSASRIYFYNVDNTFISCNNSTNSSITFGTTNCMAAAVPESAVYARVCLGTNYGSNIPEYVRISILGENVYNVADGNVGWIDGKTGVAGTEASGWHWYGNFSGGQNLVTLYVQGIVAYDEGNTYMCEVKGAGGTAHLCYHLPDGCAIVGTNTSYGDKEKIEVYDCSDATEIGYLEYSA